MPSPCQSHTMSQAGTAAILKVNYVWSDTLDENFTSIDVVSMRMRMWLRVRMRKRMWLGGGNGGVCNCGRTRSRIRICVRTPTPHPTPPRHANHINSLHATP